MNVKERIISLRLVERNEKNDAFFEQIGVTATVKVNDTNPEMAPGQRQHEGV